MIIIDFFNLLKFDYFICLIHIEIIYHIIKTFMQIFSINIFYLIFFHSPTITTYPSAKCSVESFNIILFFSFLFHSNLVSIQIHQNYLEEKQRIKNFQGKIIGKLYS